MRLWSGALFVFGLITALYAGFESAAEVLVLPRLWALALPLGAAVSVWLGTRVALTIARPRGARPLGITAVRGTVRRDEREALVVDTALGVVTLDRRLDPELGSHRSMDLSIGTRIAFFGQLKQKSSDADPFRTETRWAATRVFEIAPSIDAIRTRTLRRARAWAGYLFVIALGAFAIASAVSHADSV